MNLVLCWKDRLGSYIFSQKINALKKNDTFLSTEKILMKYLEQCCGRLHKIKKLIRLYSNNKKYVLRATTNARAQGGNTGSPITIGMHQGSILNPCLFVFVLDVFI